MAGKWSIFHSIYHENWSTSPGSYAKQHQPKDMVLTAAVEEFDTLDADEDRDHFRFLQFSGFFSSGNTPKMKKNNSP